MTTIVDPPSPLPAPSAPAVPPTPVAAPPAPSPFVVAPADAGMSLVNAFFATSPGLVVDPASVIVIRGGTSVAFYDGSLALGIGPGILLTSGTVPGTSNTVGWFGVSNGMNGDPDLDAVVNKAFQTTSYDATSLSFDFTVTDPSITGISFNVVFGTDEYPEWVDAFVDIAVVMVNGVNVAYFGNDPNAPLSVISQNLAAGYFIDNSGSGLPIEYDGVSKVLTVFSPVHQGLNTIKIAVADTGDHIYDSGLFISNFQSTNLPVTGVVVNEPCTEGADDIVGTGGGEILDGLGGDDVLDGAAGDDILSGGSGNDQLLGGLGADFIDGGSGVDTLDGGGGDDTLQFSGADTINGGAGTDKLLIDLSASVDGVILDLSNAAAVTTLADGSTITGIEVLSFVGGAGADQVTGGALADQIAGGAGDDLLNGGGGNDAIDGGDGIDVAVFSGASSDYLVNSVAGGVSVQDLRPGAPSGIDTLLGIETLRFSDGDFTPAALVMHGEAIIGTFGDDVVSGVATVPGQGFATDFADTISTGAGDDIVSGEGGNDIITLGLDRDMAYGGLGDDRISGGGENDEIWGDAGVDTAVYSGLQSDYLVEELGDGFTVTDLRPGSPDGIDDLVGIEYLAFADVTVKLIVGQAPQIVGGDTNVQFSELASPTGVAALAGAVSFYEANHDDTHTVSLAGMTGDQTGVTFQTSLAADSDGENPGSAAWTLNVDTAQIEVLAEGQTRTLTYTVRITDSAGNATDQVVTIDLVGTNDAPVVSGPVVVAVSGTDAPVTISAMTNVSDIDGGAKPHMSGPPAVLPAGVSFDPISQTFTFDPHDPDLLAQTGGASATVHVDYMVTDGLAEVPARVTFAFTGGNTAPVSAGLVDGGVLNEDGALASLNLLAAATDPGDVLTVVGAPSVLVTAGAWTAPLVAGLVDGQLTLDPDQFNSLALGESVSFQLDYAVADTAGSQIAGQAVFTVEGANDAPNALAISASHVNEAAAPGALVAKLLAADVDRGDTLTFSIAADPSGLFAIDGDRLVVAAGAVISAAAAASHTLGLRVTDAAGASFLQSVTIQVDSLSGVTIVGSKLADLIDATHGPAGQPAVTNAADTISGGLGNDTLHGLGGADTLRGDAGNDALLGGQGTDTLDGGAGVDVIDGGLGDDTIVIRGVEAIKDSFQGGQGEEALGDAVQAVGLTSVSLTGFNAGAQGIERWIGNGLGIVGGSTAELFNLSSLTAIAGLAFVDAGAGNDTLVGSSFADDLRGGSGNDSLDGGAGDDILTGGSGNDQYRVDSAGDQVVELVSGGTDTVLTTVDFSLAGRFVENLTILGPVGRTGVGNAFNNILNGGGGADSLFGDAGKDVLDGGLGADLLDGGLGDDTYWVDDAGDMIVELAGGGTDKVYATGGSYLLSGNLETLVYAGAGAFAGTGNAGANSITGGDLGDSLDGAGGDDKLFGGLGQDTLTGGDGKDILDGGGDADLLIGGAGNDTYLVDDALDIIVETTGGGLDIVRATASAYALSEEIETLVFAGTGDFNGVGNALANSITGGAGQDTLSGLGGADKLVGGAGDDVLIGGAGSDTLTGGLGADVFAYGALSDSLMSGQDRIADFNQTQGDLIDLSALDANSLLDGDQAFDFIGSAAFSHTAGEMRFVTAGAMTTLSVDVNGDGVSDFAVRLTGAINLTAGDFLL